MRTQNIIPSFGSIIPINKIIINSEGTGPYGKQICFNFDEQDSFYCSESSDSLDPKIEKKVIQ